jgi:uncharacterized protein with NRDE domain
MCLLVFAWRRHAHYPLVLAGNRDEFHARPAAPASWWDDPEGLLAGRDLQAGGTWLGVTRNGRAAVVTNYRELGERLPDAPSRGGLIVDYARSRQTPQSFLAQLAVRAQAYAGFNLIAGDAVTLAYYSNRNGAPRVLPPGIYGLSNHLLDTPWPKLTRVRERFASALAADRADPDSLLALLDDRTPARDDERPDTGLPAELERALSAPFIVTPTYGTRCSTALTFSADGRCTFVERRFDAEGSATGDARFEFATATPFGQRGIASDPSSERKRS